MADERLPWNEHASAVGRSVTATESSATLLFEGTLLDVARALATWSAADLSRVRVSLPDRHAAPRSFDGYALVAVIERSEREALSRRIGFPLRGSQR
jgi:hypothetical protein